MARDITRRDFVQGTLLGAGATLLQAKAPSSYAYDRAGSGGPSADWYGYGGIGDYVNSHGNTPGVVKTAHNIRDGRYNQEPAGVIETGEVYDLLIVGAGISGLGAAYEHSKQATPEQKCLIIENHPIFGGEAKRNQFEVEGYKLIGPQGSNGFSVPNSAADRAKHADFSDLRYMRELGIPYDFTYGSVINSDKNIRLSRDDYGYQFWQEDSTSVAHFFQGASPEEGEGRWINDPIQNNYRDLPIDEQDRKDIARWRASEFKAPDRPDFERWLDTFSYQFYLEEVLGFRPAVTHWADRILAGGAAGCDLISAYGAMRLGMPVTGEKREYSSWTRNSMPGGNDGFARHFVKKIMPYAISGGDNFEDIIGGKVNFESLDRPGQRVRMRLESTAVRIHHEGDPSDARLVSAVYESGGKVYRVRAKRAVMASGGWVNKHVIRDLPIAYRQAYDQFDHLPFLVANVAVRNWRFMERLGAGACMWNDGIFGNSCNIRLPMTVGGHQTEMDPDGPAVLTFYVPFATPGLSLQEQGIKGRWELFGTSYAQFEEKIRAQMVQLFSPTGFDPDKDIAGIVLNRWGHAYVAPQPGFFYGKNGQPAPKDIISESFGRIAIAHAELEGIQHWGPAADQGRRAVRQLAAFM